MKSCLNCRHLAQNFSKLNEYQQSVSNPQENYTCESGKGFTDTWLFGNPKEGMGCGGKYYEPNPDKRAAAKVVNMEDWNRQRIYQKIVNRKMK